MDPTETSWNSWLKNYIVIQMKIISQSRTVQTLRTINWFFEQLIVHVRLKASLIFLIMSRSLAKPRLNQPMGQSLRMVGPKNTRQTVQQRVFRGSDALASQRRKRRGSNEAEAWVKAEADVVDDGSSRSWSWPEAASSPDCRPGSSQPPVGLFLYPSFLP